MLKEIIPESLRRLAIIGMSKNAGKSTVLNKIVEELSSQRRIGLISIGVDGEALDAWSMRPKPAINLPRGSLVVTARIYLEHHPLGTWQILGSVDKHPIFGELYLAKANQACQVKLAGINHTLKLEEALKQLGRAGAQLTLIDGAYDRRSLARPDLADAVILVIGGSLGCSLCSMIQQAEVFRNLFELPVVSNSELLELGKNMSSSARLSYLRGNKIITTELSSLFRLGDYKVLLTAKAIALPGALTNEMLFKLIELKIHVPIIVMDLTSLFISQRIMQRFIRGGGGIYVMNPIKLLAVAANPTSPDCDDEYFWDPDEMMNSLASVFGDIPVLDVVRRVRA